MLSNINAGNTKTAKKFGKGSIKRISEDEMKYDRKTWGNTKVLTTNI